jgi:ParB/RepB/Spo0J family partition protein
MTTAVATPERVALDLIDVGQNVRELDQAHVQALASSIALRGLIVPLVVRADGERFTLVAGYHRYAACRSLGLHEVEVTLREREGSSADTAAENVVRKQLSPLEEARAVQHILDDGYTLEGAASALGWSQALVSARAKILALPEAAQRLLGSGELPVSAVATLTSIAEVSPELCAAAVAPVADGHVRGSHFANDPGWAIGHALRDGTCKAFAAYLGTLSPRDVEALHLGKQIAAAYAEADELHNKLVPYAYGPPSIRFGEAEVDQARAAGVLIEFARGTPIITDRALYRELAKQAVKRTADELRAQGQLARERASRRAQGQGERTPEQQLDADHRASVRTLKERAHATNLDLGSALLQKLAAVAADDMDVARFFAYGLLGPHERGYAGSTTHTVTTLAANGIRLVIEDQRTTATATLKSGKPGMTKVAYGEVEAAAAWLWKFIDGAGSAGELYGRALVVFAAQHYAQDLVLPESQRRASMLPRSRKEAARKAFERLTKAFLPASHVQLRRALEREARAYERRRAEVIAPAEQQRDGASAPDEPLDGDGELSAG